MESEQQKGVYSIPIVSHLIDTGRQSTRDFRHIKIQASSFNTIPGRDRELMKSARAERRSSHVLLTLKSAGSVCLLENEHAEDELPVATAAEHSSNSDTVKILRTVLMPVYSRFLCKSVATCVIFCLPLFFKTGKI
jgi:hypothetical protein